MYSLGDNYFTPSIYQDIGSSSLMNPMVNPMLSMPFGLGIYGGHPSYLNGVSMQPQLSNDKFITMNVKDKQDRNVMKTALKVFGVLTAITMIGPLVKSIKNAKGVDKFIVNQIEAFKNLFRSKQSFLSKSKTWTVEKYNSVKTGVSNWQVNRKAVKDGASKKGLIGRMRTVFNKKT